MRTVQGAAGTSPNIPTSESYGCQKENKKSKKLKNLFEKIMKENFPNLMKEIDIQVQEAQRVPNKLYPKRTTPRHIIIKMPKVKNIKREF